MINKKLGVLLVISLLLAVFFLQFVRAENLAGLPFDPSKDPQETIEDFRNKTISKWDYLGREWQTIFLKNKYVAIVDNFFKKNPKVFFILFGTPYSLSLTLLLIIALWLVTAFWVFRFSKLLNLGCVFLLPFLSLIYFNIEKAGEKLIKIRNTFFMKYAVSLLLAFGISMALGHLKILKFIVEGAGKIIFFEKDISWKLIAAAIVIGIFIFINWILSAIIKDIKVSQKRKKEKQQEKKLEQLEKEVTRQEVKEAEEEVDEETLEGKSFFKAFLRELGKPEGQSTFDVPEIKKPKID